ncbi:MAG: flagellar hook assembly protein FlgD [Gammaproteobacteria bacterium]
MLNLSSIFPSMPPDSGSSASEGSTAPRKQLGQSEFFELMTAQLQHQDPLNPTENDALIAQVAQFSAVDGIHQMQRSIQALAGSFQSTQALQASTLVGREVLINTDRAVLEQGKDVVGAIDLDAPVGALSVEVTTPSGARLRKIELGPQESGRVSFAWDGLDDGGQRAAPGQYIVQALVERDGATLKLPTLLQSKVESVTLNREPGTITLNLRHHNSVALEQIAELW